MPVINTSWNTRVANDNWVYVSWWACPLLWFAGLLGFMGMPIDKVRLINFVRRHSIKVRKD